MNLVDLIDDPELIEVQRLRLGPGDVLVAMYPCEMSETVQAAVYENLAQCFPDNRVMVLSEGMSLSVV